MEDTQFNQTPKYHPQNNRHKRVDTDKEKKRKEKKIERKYMEKKGKRKERSILPQNGPKWKLMSRFSFQLVWMYWLSECCAAIVLLAFS